jgi:hypothetical protein
LTLEKERENMKIESIWNDILKHEGEIFQTARGIRFTYKVLNDHEIQPYVGDKSRWKLSKEVFNKALEFPKFSGTEFSKKIIGSSYVAGILNDKRIGA